MNAPSCDASDLGGAPVLQRRTLLRLGGIAVAGATVAGCGGSSAGPSAGPTTATGVKAAGPDRSDSQALTAEAALARLQAGNARFVAGQSQYPDQSGSRRAALAVGQHPFAQVLSCADSRVVPELAFDQGLGDLFITRSAGEVVDDAVLGTIQFGTSEFGIPLLVVLGHKKCGAVKATVEAVEKHSPASGTAVDSLVAAIRPAVEAAVAAKATDVLDAAVRNNVGNVVRQLSLAPVLGAAVTAKKLRVVGAIYDLATGSVTVS